MVTHMAQMVLKVVLMTPKVTFQGDKIAPEGPEKCPGSFKTYPKRARKRDPGDSNSILVPNLLRLQ